METTTTAFGEVSLNSSSRIRYNVINESLVTSLKVVALRTITVNRVYLMKIRSRRKATMLL